MRCFTPCGLSSSTHYNGRDYILITLRVHFMLFYAFKYSIIMFYQMLYQHSIIIRQQMGAVFPCCVREENLNNYDRTVDMTAIPMFPRLRFAFSKLHAQKLQYSDCVIVNASKKHPQNQYYFKHLNHKQLDKIKQLITNDQPGTIEVITNPLDSLSVKDIIIIHLPVWGQPNANEDLANAMNKAFEEAIKRNHRNIMITEIEEERGIPTNLIYKLIVTCIQRHQEKLDRIMFNIQDPVKMEYFKKQLSGDKVDGIERTTSIPSSDLSR